MKKNAMYYITIILTILFILVSTYSYAAEVTKESLTKFYEDLDEQEDVTITGTFKVIDDEIIITDEEGRQSNIKYDLTDKPTFSTEAVFKKEATYDETMNEEENIINSLMGFIATASIYGEDTKEAMFYIILSFTSHMEELGLEEIEESEFTNAIDYAQKRYAKDILIKDELYTINIKKGVLNGDTYTVEAECIVVSEEQFSKIIENRNGIDNTMANSIIGGVSNSIVSMKNEIVTNTNTIANETINNTVLSISTPLPTKTPSTANIGTMPNAGFELNALNILKIVLGLSLAGVIIYSIYNKRYSLK